MPYITLSAGELSQAASKAAVTAASYRGKNDILSRARLIVTGATGFFSASNGAQTVTQRFKVDKTDLPADKVTEVLFDGAKLRSIISSYKTLSPTTTVKIQWEDDFGASKGLVSASRSKLKIDTDNPASYPAPLKMKPDAIEFYVGLESIQQALRAAKHAVAVQHTNVALNGLHLTVEDGLIEFTSTDGHRLYTTSLSTTVNGSAKSVLPTQVIDMITNINAETLGEEAKVRVDDVSIEFTSGNSLIRSSVIDAAYPETKVFLSSQPQWFTEIEKGDLVAALQRLQAGVNAKLPAVSMTVDVANKTLLLTTSDKGVIVGEDSVELFNAQACEQTLSFNLNYLLDAFGAVLGSKTKLGVNAERGYLVLQDANSISTGIVMPMAV